MNHPKKMVGVIGIEPTTFPVSRGCSPTELHTSSNTADLRVYIPYKNESILSLIWPISLGHMTRIPLALLIILLASPTAQGAIRKPTMSSELEFTNAEILKGNHGPEGQAHLSDENLAAQEAWAEKMRNYCKRTKTCSVEERYDMTYAMVDDDDETILTSDDYPNYRIKYRDGFYYDVTLDPFVIEIKLKPMTLEEAIKHQEKIQRDIFDLAAGMGLHPPKKESSQIHLGVKSAFGAKNEITENFRNFVAGMILTHQELWVLFIDDTSNAPPLSSLHESQTLAFEAIIEDIDKKLIKDYHEFCKRMKRDVYGETFDADMVSDYDKANKYHAVNVNRLCKRFGMDEKTTEFRSLPPQTSAAVILKLYTLFDAYVNWLALHPGKQPLKRFNPKKSATHQWVRDYIDFIKMIGLNPKDYAELLQPKYRDLCSKKLRQK